MIGLVASSFAELPDEAGPSAVDGPLGWPGYDDALASAAERTGERESVVCGVAEIGGCTAVLLSFEFGFLGGSLGTRTGARIEQAFTAARELGVPVVSLIATGGSRMQEGTAALTQLQRIARQLVLTRAAGLPHIAVLRDPTTGGGWATLGAGADVVLGLRGAQVGFAGSRVRPPGYTVTQQFASGQVDQLVTADELRVRLERWLRLLTCPLVGTRTGPEGAGLAGPAGLRLGGGAARSCGRPAAGPCVSRRVLRLARTDQR